MATTDFMRPRDIEAFKRVARHFDVYIGVRRTNPHSLPYMDRAGYSAKRLDCKPKTADRDVLIDGKLHRIAGLVVDPTIVGPRAFDGDKFFKAKKAWDDFSKLLAKDVHDAEGQARFTYFPGGKFYGVQMDKRHEHYGCVMISPSSLISAATYIHGDYDLYSIVPAASPGRNLFVEEERLGQLHVRSKELLDVQTMLNRLIGRPMVLHGDQEKYSDHTDEDIDVFFPDGTVTEVFGKKGIEQLYRTQFQGRPAAGEGAWTEPAGGLWRQVRR